MRGLICFILFFALSLSQLLAQNDIFTSYVDFGAPRSEYPFNSFLDVEVGAQQNLGAYWGCGSIMEIVVVDDFAGTAISGTNTIDLSLGFPLTATSDGFYGHTQPINGVTNPTGAIEIRNLTISDFQPIQESVEITLFASSPGATNKQTCYTLFGRDTVTVCLNAANNISRTSTVRMIPAERSPGSFQGYIRIEATAGPDNDTPEGLFYLNALSVVDENVAYTLNMFHSFPRSWDIIPKIFEVGEVVPIPGVAFSPCFTDVAVEIDGVIVDTISDVYHFWEFDWLVPNYPTDNARLIFFNRNQSVPTERFATSLPFRIIEPTDSCTIVVLGSESAAGAGPRAVDSVWVNRFRRSYKQYDTRVEVVNLAQADQSTFQLLPTGASIPAGINETVDIAHNITAALAFNPEAIIINLQADDALRGYGAAQQLANYEEIIQAAGNVPVYITTPQPGEYDASVMDIQLEMVDSTLARFGESAIDFWTPIAEIDGTIDSIYSAVDRLQLSNAGHRLLWQNVIEKQLDTLLTCQRVSSTSSPVDVLPLSLKLAPNPSQGEISVSFDLDKAGQVSLEIFNLMGQQVKRLSPAFYGSGKQQIYLQASELPIGVYTVRAAVQVQGEKQQIGVALMVIQ